MKRFVLAVCVLFLLAAPVLGAEIHDVYAEHGMVSSAHELASLAGVEILQKGGNAIDAAIATQLALNVVEPNASGIGGGGFMTIRFAKTGEVVELDYREVAPLSATKGMYASEASKKAKESQLGGKAVAVPGAVAGIFAALERYGTMTFAQVAEPAIRLAEKGFEVAPMQKQIVSDEFQKLEKYSPNCAFLPEGLPPEPGTILKQPELAKTFRILADQGPKGFYTGPVAEAIVGAVNTSGGVMTLQDLNGYSIKVQAPIKGTYRGYTIYSAPPASSGGAHVIQILNIMENFPVKDWGFHSPKHLHVLAEAMKLAFADRQKYMADSSFVDVPLSGLTDKAYAKLLSERISLLSAAKEVLPGDPWKFQTAVKKSYKAGAGSERVSTSSFSVVDTNGNIVASTNTVNYFFGSGVVVPGYGFVLNNEMDDFAPEPESVNAPEPGKRPLSSMSPTIILDPQGKPYMTLGAAGATRIITALAQIIMNTIDFRMTMDQAIEQPRIFCSASGGKAGKLLIEEGLAPSAAMYLTFRGHEIETRPFSGFFGVTQGILFDHAKKRMDGGADSRRLGVPVGF